MLLPWKGLHRLHRSSSSWSYSWVCCISLVWESVDPLNVNSGKKDQVKSSRAALATKSTTTPPLAKSLSDELSSENSPTTSAFDHLIAKSEGRSLRSRARRVWCPFELVDYSFWSSGLDHYFEIGFCIHKDLDMYVSLVLICTAGHSGNLKCVWQTSQTLL